MDQGQSIDTIITHGHISARSNPVLALSDPRHGLYAPPQREIVLNRPYCFNCSTVYIMSGRSSPKIHFRLISQLKRIPPKPDPKMAGLLVLLVGMAAVAFTPAGGCLSTGNLKSDLIFRSESNVKIWTPFLQPRFYRGEEGDSHLVRLRLLSQPGPFSLLDGHQEVLLPSMEWILDAGRIRCEHKFRFFEPFGGKHI